MVNSRKEVMNLELSVNESGKIVQSIGNCVKVISSDERLKDMFAYNELTGKVEISGAWWNQPSVNLTDNAMNNIRFYLEAHYGLIHEKNIPRAVEIVANEKSYHPVKRYFEGLKRRDDKKYIENLLPRYLGAEKSPYTTKATELIFLGMIARTYNPGTKIDQMVCLVDPLQGGGKSTMARFIAGRDEWFTDDLKSLDDENIFRKLQGHSIVEFSEMLASSNAKTVESVKSFISRQKDTYKLPYDKYQQDFLRTCIFIGTTNNLNFLPNDRSGNRRFVPVRCYKERAEVHPLDDEAETRDYVEQALAEALEIYRGGNYSLTMPKDLQPALLELQQSFAPEDSRIGVIQEWLDTCGYSSVCTRMIYKEALRNEYQEPKEWELRDISDIMNRSISGWAKHPTSDSKIRFTGYGKQRAWDRIVPVEEVPEGFMRVSIGDMNGEIPFK